MLRGPPFLRLKYHGWRLVRPVALGMCVLSAATLNAQSRSGQFAATGQRTLWLECRGIGSPTVVFEDGHGEDADTWDVVYGQVALLTHACRYDRAGRGRSAPATGIRSGRDVVADLHAVLRSAGVPGPLVLVGHSLGGAFDDEMPPDWSPEQRSARERLRRELQVDLARLAGEGTLEWGTKSGHFVHHDEPALVVVAIRALVLSAR